MNCWRRCEQTFQQSWRSTCSQTANLTFTSRLILNLITQAHVWCIPLRLWKRQSTSTVLLNTPLTWKIYIYKHVAIFQGSKRALYFFFFHHQKKFSMQPTLIHIGNIYFLIAAVNSCSTEVENFFPVPETPQESAEGCSKLHTNTVSTYLIWTVFCLGKSYIWLFRFISSIAVCTSLYFELIIYMLII